MDTIDNNRYNQALRDGNIPVIYDFLHKRNYHSGESYLSGCYANMKTIEYFYYLGYDMSHALQAACDRDHCDVVDWLISRGIMKKHLLFYPCRNKNIQMFNTLLDQYVERNMDLNESNVPFAKNALHAACMSGQIYMAMQLYNYGADLHILGEAGGNCLHYAVISGNKELVTILLDLGVQFVSDNYGTTPLHRACESDKYEIVKLLREFPHTKNRRGKLPSDLTTDLLTLDILMGKEVPLPLPQRMVFCAANLQ